jgi:hypothetical protein
VRLSSSPDLPPRQCVSSAETWAAVTAPVLELGRRVPAHQTTILPLGLHCPHRRSINMRRGFDSAARAPQVSFSGAWCCSTQTACCCCGIAGKQGDHTYKQARRNGVQHSTEQLQVDPSPADAVRSIHSSFQVALVVKSQTSITNGWTNERNTRRPGCEDSRRRGNHECQGSRDLRNPPDSRR